ncbi:DUF5691 domain-containing protein [Tsukamurella pseudospumae]|uniref:HEAT repeat domain-containing protein n=1 Tax=Tsukamurella pseudospumae TaxID=239498 RepID=A0A137ZTE8_9ACTN|nr:DUF5691 domain-containing protein [Tsukamurella pseudospumae]KXP01457.1 hypothetical protein AXK61_01180 [Tsukamurella pseudospumae]
MTAEHWPATVSAALLGTGTRRTERTGADPVISGALARVPADAPPNILVLHTAALTATALNAEGAAPIRGLTPLPAADEDPRPPMPRALAGTVVSALRYPDSETWCLGRVAEAGLRAPTDLIPRLLRFTAERPGAAAPVSTLVGPRGAWLAAAAPSIGARLDGDRPDPADWEDGSDEARARYVRSVRRTDPAAATELVDAAWKDTRVAGRAALLRALAVIPAGPGDDALLERALDDRSKEVRAAAQEALAGGVGTSYHRRMRDRAREHVSLSRGLLGGLKLTVRTPDGLDAADTRDGIVGHRSGMGRTWRRQWADQITAALPLADWEDLLGAAPSDLVTARDDRDDLLPGWIAAAARRPDPRWTAALASTGAPGALALLPGPWPPDLADRVGTILYRAAQGTDWQLDEGVDVLLDAAAARLPVGPASPWPDRAAQILAAASPVRARYFAALPEILRLRTAIEQELP